MSEILKKIEEAVYEADEDLVVSLTEEALAAGVDPLLIIQEGGVKALDRLGDDFNELIVFLPQMMVAGEAMKKLIKLVNPHLAVGTSAFLGKVVIGCAKGDLHDIGKSLVATQLAVNGFDVEDLGVDVSNNKFIERAAELNADIIAVSSLLTTSQYYMEDLIKRLASEDLRKKYRVIVGGGPIGPEYAKKIGADGYSRTAHGCVKLCKEIIKKAPDSGLVSVIE